MSYNPRLWEGLPTQTIDMMIPMRKSVYQNIILFGRLGCSYSLEYCSKPGVDSVLKPVLTAPSERRVLTFSEVPTRGETLNLARFTLLGTTIREYCSLLIFSVVLVIPEFPKTQMHQYSLCQMDGTDIIIQ